MRHWLKKILSRRGAPPANGRLSLLEMRIARLEAANVALEARLELLSGDATMLAKALLAARASPADPGIQQ